VLVLSALTLSAGVPQIISYQGHLTDNSGTIVTDGTYQLTFKIWDAEVEGTEKWSEIHAVVAVSNGLFNVFLGSVTTLPDSVFNQPNRWLGISLGDEEILPRTKLTSVPYAYNAQSLKLSPTDVPEICNEANKGSLYYDGSQNEPCYCDGTDWVQLDGGGLCNYTCADLDGDGYDDCSPGDPGDTDGLPADCDDGNTSINPGSSDVAGDGIDQNCDGFDDCYQDLDDDNYGSGTILSDNDLDCDNVSMPNTSSITGDCNDGNASINPGSAEVIGDAVDQNCDGFDDCYQDLDDDNYGSGIILSDNDLNCDNSSTPNTSSITGDCNDGNAAINPGSAEVIGDGVDQNCDGFDDCYQDLDDDGYGSGTTLSDNDLNCDNSSTPNTTSITGDCNDGNANSFPGNTEICDGYDNDCVGGADFPGEITNLDSDPSLACDDCDDNDPNRYPGNTEICDDGIDNDCDDLTDCEDTDCGCPSVGDLVITEYMANPSALSDAVGEWFEIKNVSGRTIDLYGMDIGNGGSLHTINEHISVGAGNFVTMANSASPGFTPDYVYVGISLGDFGGQIRLEWQSSTVIDVVTYILASSGNSDELSMNHVDATLNDNSSNWCSAVSRYGSGDYGTPGAANDCVK
jgi:hypothetical protein